MRTLKINLFYNCTAKCSHCRFNCDNESARETPDFEIPYNTAKKLKDNLGLDLAVVLGGEPTIFRNETIDLLHKLKSLEIATRLETNASWAGSFDDAISFLTPLKGIDQVMLSSDGFHDPFIPVQHTAKRCAFITFIYDKLIYRFG